FSIRSSASLTKNDILPPLSYVLIFSFYHICFFLPIMQWSFLFDFVFGTFLSCCNRSYGPFVLSP
ncbi:hypothetical protein, partial [Candidatus Bandiella numerosa]|uniref:hypothetical protein n=1 Tax=Candidatus Bandiella numerosa TaxID=2570586 RepID=UPI001F47053D